jgi:transcription elongation factor Elf1
MEPRIEFHCLCGKSYRVSARKAGKKVSCKVCGHRFRVPGVGQLSKSSRGNILLSFGIDPEAAEQAFMEESSRESPADRVYHCTHCQGAMGQDDLQGGYIKGELVCRACRDAASVEDRRLAREAEERHDRRADVALVTPYDARRAAIRAAVHGAVFFLGFAGPPFVIFGAPVLASVAVGAVVALVGGALVFHRG